MTASPVYSMEKIAKMINDPNGKEGALQMLSMMRFIEPNVFVSEPVQNLMNGLALDVVVGALGKEELKEMDAEAIRKKMLDSHVAIVKCRLITENCGVYHHHVGQCDKEFVKDLKASLLFLKFHVKEECINALDSDDEAYVAAGDKKPNVLKISV